MSSIDDMFEATDEQYKLTCDECGQKVRATTDGVCANCTATGPQSQEERLAALRKSNVDDDIKTISRALLHLTEDHPRDRQRHVIEGAVQLARKYR